MVGDYIRELLNLDPSPVLKENSNCHGLHVHMYITCSNKE
jgi:hypothetical protein